MREIIKRLLKVTGYSFLCFFMLVPFFFCCHNSDKKTIGYDKSNENKYKYTGEWISVERPIPYHAVLKIDSSFNFTYEGGACLLAFSSKGNWTLNSDTLILTSFKPTECCYISDFGVNCFAFDPAKPDSIKDCIPEKIYYLYIILNREKFLIKDSILIHMRKTDNICPEIKDDFIKKTK
ncbi:MAG: hypothetical protein FWF54_05490 [Candidatus Azobacteroides sp.]|nr:hypothetical protein [Candidatus Azobacteroides sp.]